MLANHRWILTVPFLAIPCPLVAQERDRFEIGTTIASVRVPDFNAFGIAIGNATSAIFLRLYTSDNVFVEPEFSLDYITSGEEAIKLVNGAVHLGRRFPSPERSGAFFAAAHVAGRASNINVLNNDVAAGASVGYWMPVLNRHGSVRMETRLRHWLDADFTDFSVLLNVAFLVR